MRKATKDQKNRKGQRGNVEGGRRGGYCILVLCSQRVVGMGVGGGRMGTCLTEG